MIIEIEINGAHVIISGDNLTVNLTEEAGSVVQAQKRSERFALPAPAQIKALRKSLGLPQHEFAKRFGVVQATVCRWERGQETPNGAAAILLRAEIDGAGQ